MPFNLFSPATWFAKQPDLPQNIPTGLFQSRITHTPGGFGDPSPSLGKYFPTMDPKQIAALQPNLTPQEQATLAQAWTPQGLGFLMVKPPSMQPSGMPTLPSDIMRHEQWHDLYNKAGLTKTAGEIAPLIAPEIRAGLKNDPTYQEEMRQSSPTNIYADEGSAYDLINEGGRMGGPSPGLADKIMQNLKSSLQKKQFQQLTARPSQSQK